MILYKNFNVFFKIFFKNNIIDIYVFDKIRKNYILFKFKSKSKRLKYTVQSVSESSLVTKIRRHNKQYIYNQIVLCINKSVRINFMQKPNVQINEIK